MISKRMARFLCVSLGIAALWGVPAAGAQARYHHPPRQSQGSMQDASGQQRQEPQSQQVSSNSDANPQSCFRVSSPECDRARQEYNRHHGDD